MISNKLVDRKVSKAMYLSSHKIDNYSFNRPQTKLLSRRTILLCPSYIRIRHELRMQLSKMTKAIGSAILSNKPLPTAGPYPTGDPYLFCVYHKDSYPAGNGKMEAPRRGNGQDFSPNQPYRMYHGTKVPGFPQHPHRGFETITATIEGLIDHADSAGNGGRYGEGDLQWMTAGAGIVHSEMFPLLKTDEPNPLRFFQIWLNLPAKSKFVKPAFGMFWANTVPVYTSDDGKVKATLWVGHNYLGVRKNPNMPPPDSWASDESNDVVLSHITIQPGGKFTLPKAHESSVNRSLYYIEGNSGSLVDGNLIGAKVSLTLNPNEEVLLEVPETATVAGEFLWMQGKPISEPVAQYGPFVMNTQQEIAQAFSDYHRTEFGGWPWPRDDMVFPAEKGRFALFNGEESFPEEKSFDEDERKQGEL
jgi:redox-sensitive bicupin YhaK (pirin superfamily)